MPVDMDMALPPEPITAPVDVATPLSAEDIEILARMIYAEAGKEPYDGKLAVAQCALDRLEDGKFGDTLYDVIMAKSQFAKALQTTTTTDDACRQVAKDALSGERMFPEWRVLYFRQSSRNEGKYGTEYIDRIGCHIFNGLKR